MTALLDQVRLHDGTVMQGFCRMGRDWLFTQVTQGGRAGLTFAEHERRGDLTLTRLSAAGDELGHMFLRGFGHGISVSVQVRAAGGWWVWAECKAQANVDKIGHLAGFGTAIGRFRWRPGKTLLRWSPRLRVFRPVAGTHVTPCLDHGRQVMAVRYTDGAGTHVARFALARFLDRDWQPLTVTAEPPTPDSSQGWAVNGQVITHYTGNAYSEANPPPGNARLTTYQADGGTVIMVADVTAGSGLAYREPEGTSPDGCVGFACGEPGHRRASIYQL